MSDRTSLGDRMKSSYEDRYAFMLPRRTNTVVRIDGKAFHTLLRHANKPFDLEVMAAMDNAAMDLCKQMQGCRMAYGQSDEYTFVLTDYTDTKTEAWFDGNLQKICSVSASIYTAAFNRYLSAASYYAVPPCTATFDSRVFVIPEMEEVVNCLIWRQQDAIRNAIQSAGQVYFSQKQLHGKNCEQIKQMLLEKKTIDFDRVYPDCFRLGRVVWKEEYVSTSEEYGSTLRTRWVVDDHIPVFTENREYMGRRLSTCNGD